ncbi:MAG TPA: hypothetical protein VFC15_12945 [Candidatus Limnocylindrales bacterium]|nr:hypothetical protein [Candidatus Limnocylindrales bacterium]
MCTQKLLNRPLAWRFPWLNKHSGSGSDWIYVLNSDLAASREWLHIGKMAPSSKKTASYRKRAKDINKRLKERASTADRVKLTKKQKALSDMADNEDWLAGKPGSQLK